MGDPTRRDASEIRDTLIDTLAAHAEDGHAWPDPHDQAGQVVAALDAYLDARPAKPASDPSNPVADDQRGRKIAAAVIAYEQAACHWRIAQAESDRINDAHSGANGSVSREGLAAIDAFRASTLDVACAAFLDAEALLLAAIAPARAALVNGRLIASLAGRDGRPEENALSIDGAYILIVNTQGRTPPTVAGLPWSIPLSEEFAALWGIE